MLLSELTVPDLADQIDATSLERGRQYAVQDRVSSINVSADETRVTSRVRGSGNQSYAVIIDLIAEGNQVDIDGQCSCPVGFNCKHVAATLLVAMAPDADEHVFATAPPRGHFAHVEKPARVEQLDYLHRQWVERIAKALRPSSTTEEYPPHVNERLTYVISPQRFADGNHRYEMKLLVARKRKDGTYGGERTYSANNVLQNSAQFILPSDKAIAQAAALTQQINSYGIFVPSGEAGTSLLKQILATRRCHWGNVHSAPLRLGAIRRASVDWEFDQAGNQRVKFRTDPPAEDVLPVTPPWYVDPVAGECGPINCGLPAEVAQLLAEAPLVKPREAKLFKAEIRKALPDAPVPSLREPETLVIDAAEPTIWLTLFTFVRTDSWYYGRKRGLPEFIDCAALAYEYYGKKVKPKDSGAVEVFRDGKLLEIKRNTKFEREVHKRLQALGFSTIGKQSSYGFSTELQDKWGMANDNAWVDFMVREAPKLRAAGWRIEADKSFRFDVIEPEDWYGSIEESGNQWFDLELGIVVQGQKLPLAGLLTGLLNEFGSQLVQRLKSLPGDAPFLVPLSDGKQLNLPVQRVRTMFSTLVELYNREPSASGKLRISKLDAARLNELDMGSSWRWQGGEQLRALGKRLAEFQGIAEVAVPAGLQGELRGYQREGLAWLQFLREYALAGILADDMGLGKTIQALAHLLIEKESGRMDRPSLVIAPTSLMHNWKLEANRFAPSLKVLVLQGLERKKDFERLADHDLILTTYPLLPRDKDVLLANEYHMVVLDEAQNIKNSGSQAARLVTQIPARHRLCLTGTPLENHLGELWSLFNFLLPGLLGDSAEFKRLYRTPIEKGGDSDRQASLARRIKPFLLRRTKEQVASELPPKTEIVERVELSGGQRDLYETIRVTMDEKVREEVKKKGFERSHIVILDALLKLRQVCCDPRLLKLDAAKKVHESAKLKLLMDLLPAMVADGRRILLFSQFTSMLALIEERLHADSIQYVKLTGDTTDRAAPIKTFQSGKVPLFLLSLKAGGVGLNLTAADTVIHYDPWWNPAVEEQATDRAHRIGQDKPVFVYKLIVAGSVEEKIAGLQARKAALAAGVLKEGGEGALALQPDDLASLFEPLGE